MRILLTMLALMITPSLANASFITTDKDLFYSMYENPTNVIDFDVLRDGRTYFQTSWSDLFHSHSNSTGPYNVMADAFNPQWHFQINNIDDQSSAYWGSIWHDGYIVANNIATWEDRLGYKAFAIYSGSSFIGYVTDEFNWYGDFGLTTYNRFDRIEYGFSMVEQQPLATPEPGTMLLMSFGAVGIAFVKRRRDKTRL